VDRFEGRRRTGVHDVQFNGSQQQYCTRNEVSGLLFLERDLLLLMYSTVNKVSQCGMVGCLAMTALSGTVKMSRDGKAEVSAVGRSAAW